MAYVKRKPISSNLKKAINYIVNGEKTDASTLVSGINCSICPTVAVKEMELVKKRFGKEDNILAFHFMQSFKPGEIKNPNLAHEIGIQFAEKFTNKEFKTIVATHIDKDHIHNHIIMNSVNSITGKKYHSCTKELWHVRGISNEITKDFGLSVITPSEENRSKSYKEWAETKKGTSWKANTKYDIDSVIKNVKSFDEFIDAMEEKGYEVKYKNLKNISFKAPGQQRFTRGKTIGNAYTEESIRKRIAENINRIDIHKYQSKEKREFIDFDVYRFRYKRGTLANNIALTALIIKNMISMSEDKRIRKRVNTKYAIKSLRELELALLFIDNNNDVSKESLSKRNLILKDEVSKADNRIKELDKLEEILIRTDEENEKYKQYTSSLMNKIKFKKQIKDIENNRSILKCNNLDNPHAKDKILEERQYKLNNIKSCEKEIENNDFIVDVINKVENKTYINRCEENTIDSIIESSESKSQTVSKENKNNELEL